MRFITRTCASLALIVNLCFRMQPATAGASEMLAQNAAGPGPRSGHSMVYDPGRRRLIVVDGYLPPHDSIGRSRASMVYDSTRQHMLLFGGAGMPAAPKEPFVMCGDTWIWKDGAWRQLPGQAPPARYAHAMAFDRRRGIVVLYGGATMTADRQTAHLEDLWQWDGERWSEIKMTGPTPGKRYSAAMAYDASRDRIVLHGGLEVRGQGEFTAFDDVWEWDGARWVAVK